MLFIRSRLVYFLVIFLLGSIIFFTGFTGCGGSSAGSGSYKVTSAISGIVTNADGVIVEGARVSAAMVHKSADSGNWENRSVSSTTSFTYTNEEGWFIITNLIPGTYLVTVEHSSFAPYTLEVVVSSDLTITLDIALSTSDPSTGTVTGTVTDIETGVELYAAPVTVGGITAVSRYDGSYTIEGIPGDEECAVSVVRPGFLEYSTTFTVPAGTTRTLDIALTPATGTVRGVVVDGSTSLPLSGVTVRIGDRSAQTNTEGEYSIPGIRTATNQYLIAYLGGYVNHIDSVDITTGSTTICSFVLNSVPAGSATVTGTITDNLPGTPVKSALVLIEGKGAFTADDGTYVINGVTVGSGRVVTCRKEGFSNYSGTVDVPEVGVNRDISLAPNVFTGAVTLSGVNAIPLSFTVVSLANLSVVRTGVADTLGNYTLTHVPAGEYTLFVERFGFLKVPELITLVSGTTLRDISMTPYVSYLMKWGKNSGSGEFGNGNGEYYWPCDIAVHPAGDIVYIADTYNYRIQMLTSRGVFVREWGSNGTANGQFKVPTGIAVDANGNVYVADRDNHRIQKFDAEGNFIRKWGIQGSGDLNFNYPSRIAVSAEGYVYVTDRDNYCVKKFDADGVFLGTWGSSGSGDGFFNKPSGIAVDAAGNVYVADNGNSRVQKFTSEGVFLTKWGSSGSGDGEFNQLLGISVDTAGYVYVADRMNSRVQKFTSEGVFVTKWGGTEGTGNGEFIRLQGLAVDAEGYVYVADTNNNRIQKFTQKP